MALVTRDTAASPDASTGMFAPQISGLVAGEDLTVGDACYVAADGTVMKSNGAAATAPAKCRGFATRTAKAGQPVTLYGRGARFRYGSGLTPGAEYFVAATAGQLDTAATVGGTVAVAFAVNATDIIVLA